MSAEMYSTNPSLFGGGALIATGWFASRPTHDPSAVWPYVVVGIGYLLYGMAISTTASVGVDDLLRVCGVMGGVSSAIAAFLLWRSPHFPLALICITGGVTVVAWAFLAAARIVKRRGEPS